VTHPREPLRFHGGFVGALLPFAVFLTGVAWLGLSGAPDERGFWPVLLAGLCTGVLLAGDRARYSEAMLRGMSRPLVMLMVSAWILAGVLGAVIQASGFIDALASIASDVGIRAGAFAAFAFAVAALVSTSTGTSLGTVILCSPLLYPAGVQVGAGPAMLIGAILAGATFGDNLSPVSDTTIASATTQDADIGGVVKSRLGYALPAAAVSLALYLFFGAHGAITVPTTVSTDDGTYMPLVMATVPTLVIVMLLTGRHLVESLLIGVIAAVALGVVAGLVDPASLIRIDADRYVATGLLLSGMERGIGVSVFTILLMGLVGGLEESGVVDRAVAWIKGSSGTPRGAEWRIFGAVSAAVLLTTHSVVAILTVGQLAKDVGQAQGLGPYRRANLLDVTVCTYPFLLPFFIPTILAASTTVVGSDSVIPRVSPLAVGLHNVHSWALLAVVLLAIAGGFGRSRRR
jgi:Na+/H+ antiporter NhaC